MRRITNSFSLLLLSGVAFALVGLVSQPAGGGDKPKADEIVSKHLDAIGPASARDGLKSLDVEGGFTEKYVRGGTGQTAGPFTMVSTGHKLILQAKFGMPDFPGEFYAFDGDKKSIGFMKPGQRSLLEDFIQNSGEVVQDGLLGGVLTTAWPFYDFQNRKARLDVDGLKKVDGKDLLRVTYHPRHGSGDLKIYLFFEPESFRHVKTIYTLQSQAMLGRSPGGMSGGAANQTLEEDFSGFSKVNNLMFPSQWTIKYSQEGLGAGSSIVQYDVVVEKVQANSDVAGVSFRIGG